MLKRLCSTLVFQRTPSSVDTTRRRLHHKRTGTHTIDWGRGEAFVDVEHLIDERLPTRLENACSRMEMELDCYLVHPRVRYLVCLSRTKDNCEVHHHSVAVMVSQVLKAKMQAVFPLHQSFTLVVWRTILYTARRLRNSLRSEER